MLSTKTNSDDSNIFPFPSREDTTAMNKHPRNIDDLMVYVLESLTHYNLINHKKNKANEATVIKLHILETKQMRNPLDVIVEDDDEGFIARTVDFPLFGYGDDIIEAIDSLKSEIESLYFDLLKDDNFTEEWLNIKKFLKKQIMDL